VQIKWVHFPLHPETPPEGQALERLFAGRDPQEIAASQARMKGLMADEGLPYGDRSMTYNSRLAQELGKWAEEQPGGERIHDTLFRAFFVELKNIGDAAVLLDIVEQVGLPWEEARKVLDERTHKAAVDADWRRSYEVGVTGVPTFVAGSYGVVGAQPYRALEILAQKAGASPRIIRP
jgi:predicted DsbA family dithiol-disulfide isomerase